MESNRMEPHSLDIRKTKFTALKDRQCSLNMRIRLAMQIHDTRVCEDLEKELQEVTEQIDIL